MIESAVQYRVVVSSIYLSPLIDPFLLLLYGKKALDYPRGIPESGMKINASSLY